MGSTETLSSSCRSGSPTRVLRLSSVKSSFSRSMTKGKSTKKSFSASCEKRSVVLSFNTSESYSRNFATIVPCPSPNLTFKIRNNINPCKVIYKGPYVPRDMKRISEGEEYFNILWLFFLTLIFFIQGSKLTG